MKVDGDFGFAPPLPAFLNDLSSARFCTSCIRTIYRCIRESRCFVVSLLYRRMLDYISSFPRQASVMTQRQLEILPDRLRKWRLDINTNKSETICFTRKSIYKCQCLSLEERLVQCTESVKYLCVLLDRSLNFNYHVTDTLKKVRGIETKLFPCSHKAATQLLHQSITLSAVSKCNNHLCKASLVDSPVDHQV